MLKVSCQSELTVHAFVTSKRHLCGCWELDERQWSNYLDLIDSFSMVENTPNPSEPSTLEASGGQKSFLKQWNVDNSQ